MTFFALGPFNQYSCPQSLIQKFGRYPKWAEVIKPVHNILTERWVFLLLDRSRLFCFYKLRDFAGLVSCFDSGMPNLYLC